jgi:hypothetical protein
MAMSITEQTTKNVVELVGAVRGESGRIELQDDLDRDLTPGERHLFKALYSQMAYGTMALRESGLDQGDYDRGMFLTMRDLADFMAAMGATLQRIAWVENQRERELNEMRRDKRAFGRFINEATASAREG